jgi:hypothetical protein
LNLNLKFVNWLPGQRAEWGLIKKFNLHFYNFNLADDLLEFFGGRQKGEHRIRLYRSCISLLCDPEKNPTEVSGSAKKHTIPHIFFFSSRADKFIGCPFPLTSQLLMDFPILDIPIIFHTCVTLIDRVV